MRRASFWLGVLAAVAVLAGGVTIAVLGYAKTAGPEGAVRGYFRALAAGDAPNALAYGHVPAGATTLLTSDALGAQQRIAPVRDVVVRATRQHDSSATVQVSYALAFPGTNVPVSVAIPLHDTGGQWRLDRVAVRVRIVTDEARQRQSILGAAVPRQPVLLFPGALPITVDTPYLKLDPFADTVGFDSQSPVNVHLDVTTTGRAAMARAVEAEVRRCVATADLPACPLPDERYVPGSVHGRVQGGVRATVTTLDPHDRVGSIDFAGRMTVSGTYRRLNFHNRQVAGRGALDLNLHATAYAVPPVRLRWTSS